MAGLCQKGLCSRHFSGDGQGYERVPSNKYFPLMDVRVPPPPPGRTSRCSRLAVGLSPELSACGMTVSPPTVPSAPPLMQRVPLSLLSGFRLSRHLLAPRVTAHPASLTPPPLAPSGLLGQTVLLIG